MPQRQKKQALAWDGSFNVTLSTDFKHTKRSKFIDLLIANKGPYIYYVEFTNELLLSEEKFANGNLILTIEKNNELELGPVTYIGKL